MTEQPRRSQKQPEDAPAGVRPGGYHSHGVPGEEAAVRKHMRVTKLTEKHKIIRNTRPIKGGLGAESTSAGRLEATLAGPAGTPPTERAIFVLARKGEELLETPVFHAGDSGEEEAVVVFTDRNKATRYLQVAGWEETHEPAPLSPTDLGQWLQEALAGGIGVVAVDPDRQAHLHHELQPVLFLREQVDQSGDNLYRELLRLQQP